MEVSFLDAYQLQIVPWRLDSPHAIERVTAIRGAPAVNLLSMGATR